MKWPHILRTPHFATLAGHWSELSPEPFAKATAAPTSLLSVALAVSCTMCRFESLCAPDPLEGQYVTAVKGLCEDTPVLDSTHPTPSLHICTLQSTSQ